MVIKADVWIVKKPFTLDGADYQKGDEWVTPNGWTLDEAKTNHVRNNPTGHPCFQYEVQVAEERKGDGPKVPVMDLFNIFLPLALKK